MKSVVAILTVVCVPTIVWAAPGAAGLGKVLAEYNYNTGELIVSSGGAVSVIFRSELGLLTPLNPPPAVPVGALVNDHFQLGIVNTGPINLTDYSFGNIGTPCDLTLTYVPTPGQSEVRIPYGQTGFRDLGRNQICIPEPSSLGLVTVALITVLRLRRYLMQGISVRSIR